MARYLVDLMPLDLGDQEASGETGTLLIGNTPGLVQALDPDPVDYNEITGANLNSADRAGGHR